MNKREFVRIACGAAVLPLAARAQEAALPLIGAINSASRHTYAHAISAFHEGLASTGLVDGRNAIIEFHWTGGRYDKLPEMVAGLLARRVAVIAAFGPPAALAAKAGAPNVPIVFTSGIDPTKLGLATSFNRPGGNSTGIHLFNTTLEAKRLALIREVVPNAVVIAFFANPKYPGTEEQTASVKAAARDLGREVRVLNAANADEINEAFAQLSRLGADVLMVGADPFFNSRRDQLVALAAAHRIPTVYNWRDFRRGRRSDELWRQLRRSIAAGGSLCRQDFKGRKRPLTSPLWQPIRFELVINLKTAKILGLEIPPTLLALADEVIE